MPKTLIYFKRKFVRKIHNTRFENPEPNLEYFLKDILPILREVQI